MDLPRDRMVDRIDFDDWTCAKTTRRLAEERPVAFEYNGLAYATMMASPRDLEDFAVGFTLAEGLVDRRAEILDVATAQVEGGAILRIGLPEERAVPLRERVRLRLVEGSCGLCGLESIAAVLRPLTPLSAVPSFDACAISRALGALGAHQPLGRATGGMHAAAFCEASGSIMAVREDVGRHNALDKLTGHLARSGIDPESGFALLSARCSYELVEKTVRARIPALVTISAPSDLAVERAVSANLTLVALARRDSALVLSDPHKVFGR